MAVAGDVFTFAVGLALLIIGAEGLVRGGSRLAARMGVSPLTIGLTVVALGTSAPELVVGVAAAWKGQPDVVLGAVIGSNILNILVVLGTTALLSPLFVQRRTVRGDLPIATIVSFVVLLAALNGVLGRLEGILLLGGVVWFLRHLKLQERSEPPPKEADPTPLWVPIGSLAAGIALLVIGGDFVVDGGTGLARALGFPDRVVALTLVALGTSAPELATAIVAASRKQVDLAIGNVVGSNVLNLLFVLGTAAVIRPIPVSDQILRVDMVIMVMTTFLLLLLLMTSSRRRIGRRGGVLLLGLYGLYVFALLGGFSPLV